MNEKEWLTSQNPQAMLRRLVGDDFFTGDQALGASDRKLRLWVASWYRHDDYYHAGDINRWLHHLFAADKDNKDNFRMADLLRDIIGNPWRPVKLTPCCVRCGCREYEPEVEYAACAKCAGDMQPPSWLRWQGGTVVHLAREIYGGDVVCGRCGGEGGGSKFMRATDWFRGKTGPSTIVTTCPDCNGSGKVVRPFNAGLMPMLGDALEDAGCVDLGVLNHCRGLRRCSTCLGEGGVTSTYSDGSSLKVFCKTPPETSAEEWPLEFMEAHLGNGKERCDGTGWVRSGSPHVKGCWVVDLLLGES